MRKSINIHSSLSFSIVYGLVFAISALTQSESVCAQTRRSAAAIPYSFEAQSVDFRQSDSNEADAPVLEPQIEQLQIQTFAFLNNDEEVGDDPFGPVEIEEFDGADSTAPELEEFPPLDDFGQAVPETETPGLETDTFDSNEFDSDESNEIEDFAQDAFQSQEPQSTPQSIPQPRQPDTPNPVLQQSPGTQRPAATETTRTPQTRRHVGQDFSLNSDEEIDWEEDSVLRIPEQSKERLEEIRRRGELRKQQQEQPGLRQPAPVQPVQPAQPTPSPQPQDHTPTEQTPEPSDVWQTVEPHEPESTPQREPEDRPAPPAPEVYPPTPKKQYEPKPKDFEYPTTDSYEEFAPGETDETLRPAPLPQLHYGSGSHRRLDQSCEIGPSVQFPDQCGYYSGYYGFNQTFQDNLHGDVHTHGYFSHETVPFAGDLVVDPCAPLLDIGGPDVNFWGYAKQGPAVRPYGWLFDNMTIFGGASGFGNKAGLLKEKNVGVFEGVNWSSSFSPRFGIGAQLGIRCVQRSIDGEHPLFEEDIWDSKGKSQVFFTGGFYRRTPVHPVQFGVVYDLMSDNKLKLKNNDKSHGTINLGQIRTELSYRSRRGLTFGFQGAFAARHGDTLEESRHYQVRATDYYLAFGEQAFGNGSAARISAGGARHGHGMLSAMFYQPLGDKLSLQTDFAYMFAKSGKNPETSIFEDHDKRSAMQFSLSLTFHPHGGAFRRNSNPIRAMFDVADNGSMLSSNRR